MIKVQYVGPWRGWKVTYPSKGVAQVGNHWVRGWRE